MTNVTQDRLPRREGYTVRLAPRERALLNAAAAAAGEKLSEFVRRALVDAARRDLAAR